MECYIHPGNEAVGACVACGHFACDVCRVTVEGKIHCKACVERGEATRPSDSYPPPSPHRTSRSLFRSGRDRVFGGVCAGLAAHLNMDVTLTRLIAGLLLLLSAGVVGIAYIVMWAAVPMDPEGY